MFNEMLFMNVKMGRNVRQKRMLKFFHVALPGRAAPLALYVSLQSNKARKPELRYLRTNAKYVVTG